MTADERRAIIDLYRGLRVTDVCDGMDRLGLHDRGSMDEEIHPLWRDVDTFAHRIYGFAHTVRFVPTQRPWPTGTPDEIEQQIARWYRELAPGPIRADIQWGDVIVIDANDSKVGFIGSNNCLSWLNAGAVGVVTNAGARDTDELIKQKCPVYLRYISKPIRPGRLEYDRSNVPVTVGGVLVRPGDLVVADGDGVIVVPIEHARAVAERAWIVAKGDKATRRQLYQARGLPPDDTV